jgi:hypothetical protein
VRDLPEEERRGEDEGLGSEEGRAGGCPPHEGRDGAHGSAHPGVVGGERLEGRVDASVEGCGVMQGVRKRENEAAYA